MSKEGWRRAAPNEVVWVDSLGNKALTASDLRRSTLRNHWSLAATRLTTGSHWNTTIDEDEGWGESKSPEPTDEATSAEVWGSAPVQLVGASIVTGRTRGRRTYRRRGGTAESRLAGRSDIAIRTNGRDTRGASETRLGEGSTTIGRLNVVGWILGLHTDKNSLGAQ